MRFGVRLQEQIDKETLNPIHPRDDLLITRRGGRFRRRQLQTVQRAFARKRTATVAPPAPIDAQRIVLAHQRGQQRIKTQGLVIV